MMSAPIETSRTFTAILTALVTVIATLLIGAVAGVVRTQPTLEFRVGLIERQVREIHAVLIPEPQTKVRTYVHQEEDQHEER